MKTKLGISVGVLGAITCWCGVLSGYLAVLVLAAYVLLKEEDGWLKNTVVKVVITMVLFDVVAVLIGFIPDILSWVTTLTRVVSEEPNYFSKVNSFVELFTKLINIIQKAYLLILGFMALNKKTINVPFVDSFIEKHV